MNRDMQAPGVAATATPRQFTASTLIISDAAEQFRHWINSHGYFAPSNIEPGRIHRLPALGKRPSNRSAACKLFADYPAGWLHDYTIDQTINWRADNGSHALTRSEIELARKVTTEAIRKREQDEAKKYAEKAQEVIALFQSLSGAQANFPYLVAKQIESFAPLFRSYNRYGEPCIVIPLEYQGKMVNWQTIDASGNKRPYGGARCKGAYCVVQILDDYSHIVICEGVATACTLAIIDPTAIVIAAMWSHNLVAVARDIRRVHPQSRIIIAGDFDRFVEGNPGRKKAIEAARAIDGEYALPDFPRGVSGTDFNDLYCAGVLV